MIKVFKTRCTKDVSYDKSQFNLNESYYAFVVGSKIVVINNDIRIGFCDMEKCMFKHGHPFGFQKHFEVLETFHVKNKKELKKINS